MNTQIAAESRAAESLEGANLVARRRMEECPGDPLFLAGWMRALFLHYEVDAKSLQRAVPFELDLWEGERALVSLVAFTIEGMRPYVGGRWTKWILAPIATHGFLNVRTYVRHGEESGIFFLREWMPDLWARSTRPAWRMCGWVGHGAWGDKAVARARGAA